MLFVYLIASTGLGLFVGLFAWAYLGFGLMAAFTIYFLIGLVGLCFGAIAELTDDHDDAECTTPATGRNCVQAT